MDLAESIRENTKAVQALTAAISAHFSFGAAAAPAEQFEVPAPAPAAPLDYDKDVKPTALALAKADRAKLITILESFGCKKATELKPDQFAAFVGACK